MCIRQVALRADNWRHHRHHHHHHHHTSPLLPLLLLLLALRKYFSKLVLFLAGRQRSPRYVGVYRVYSGYGIRVGRALNHHTHWDIGT